MSDLAPGDLVECVDVSDRPGSAWEPGCAPTLGAVYTVVSFIINPVDAKTVTLAELANGDPDWGYLPQRFRKLYRPSETFLNQCLKPVDLDEEVSA